MQSWNNIYLTGKGKSQITGPKLNLKADNSKLKSFAPLLNHLSKIYDENIQIDITEVDTINIINGVFVIFRPISSENKFKRIAWNSIDLELINNLSNEIIAIGTPVNDPYRILTIEIASKTSFFPKDFSKNI